MNYKKPVRKLAYKIFENFNQTLHRIETRTQHDKESYQKLAPVFILGLPRSGTTLLYQLLLNYFDWIYLSASLDYFYGSPVSISRLQRFWFPKAAALNYQSEYGLSHAHSFSTKLWSPIEGHRVWQRWFSEEPTHYHGSRLSPEAVREMRCMVAGLMAIANQPFLNKNPRHCMRLLPLSQAFPEALFIVLKRDLLYVAQSLYVARIRKRPRPDPNDDWWGTKPREYLRLKHQEPMIQAVGQAKAIESELEHQLAACNNRYIEFNYNDVCREPERILHELQTTCLDHGIPLQRIRNDIPEPFSFQNEKKSISDTEFDRLRKLLGYD